MNRFWVLTLGLSLTVITSRDMSNGGIDSREFALLALMLGLTALALIIEGVCSAIEARYTVVDDDEGGPTDPADPPAVAAAHPHPELISPRTTPPKPPEGT